MHTVSVIMPAFNMSKFITQSIQSVLKQTFEDFELIIVDDCSSDNTYEIACEFSRTDKRVVALRNETHFGAANTRNRALEYADGDYIAFLDSDDIWLPEKLERQLEFMRRNDHALTYTAYQKLDSTLDQRGKIIKAPKSMNAKQIIGNTAIGCLTVMVNRKKVGDFSMPDISHCEDNCTWQSILKRGYTAYGLNEVLALYRERKGSQTSEKKAAAKKQWRVYRDYYGFSFVKSAFYFAEYAARAFIKHYL